MDTIHSSPDVIRERAPDIDVVIAVHTSTRPLHRAIQSCAVKPSGPAVRVTVVCHNISIQEIRESLSATDAVDLRFLELYDGINSPAGPKNLGLDAATAPFVCMLDSDDYLEPDALSYWHEKLLSEAGDAVVAPVRNESGSIIKTPRARPGRCVDLDPVKDGLAYATAMRGLWKSDIGGERRFRYVNDLRVGEDLAPGLQIYYSDVRILFPRKGPAYVLGNEAEDRVTAELLPLEEEFRAIFALPKAWLSSLLGPQRLSVAAKIARTSLVSSIVRRRARHTWTQPDLTAIECLAEFLEELATGYRSVMTIRDSKLLASALTASQNGQLFETAIRKHHEARLLSKVLCRKPCDNFKTESQMRHFLKAILDRRR